MANNIIDVDKINSYIDLRGDEKQVEKILNKALELKGLGSEEIAVLLNLEDEYLLGKLFKTAKKIKEDIHGKKIVFFAPLYVSNYCSNNCVYCGLRHKNKELKRTKLTPEEVLKEAEYATKTGNKRILLSAGEDTKACPLDYIKEVIDKIYSQKVENSEIEKPDLNFAPLSVEDFKRAANFKIGTFQIFQETYHPVAYKRMHSSGMKSNYNWRLEVWDRAIDGGIKDFGMGALFGLYDYRFEVLSLIEHSKYLLNKYGIGPQTISVPRVEPFEGSNLSKKPPYVISDIQFKKIIAVLKLAIPHTEMILTTRESAELQREAIELGITQVSTGTYTNTSGYSQKIEEDSTNKSTLTYDFI